MFISEQGRIYFLSFLCFPQGNDRKWLDFYHFLNTLKNIFLPDINGQIIEQDKKKLKLTMKPNFLSGLKHLDFNFYIKIRKD